MKKRSKQLVLSRETLRRLEAVDSKDLGHVQGGCEEDSDNCVRRDPDVAYIE